MQFHVEIESLLAGSTSDRLDERTRETGGVGLGLAIVKSFVESYGGRVAVRNLERAGLELTFTLQRTA